MKVPSILIRGILAGFFVCGGVGAANADEILRAKLRSCAKDGTTFGDVGSCGKVWKLGSGEVKLEADGKIKVSEPQRHARHGDVGVHASTQRTGYWLGGNSSLPRGVTCRIRQAGRASSGTLVFQAQLN